MKAAVALILIGIVGVVANRNLMMKVISLEITNVGVVMLFVALSYSPGSLPPIYEPGVKMANPVPQAVIITAIVIGFSILALSVSIVSELVESTRRERSDDMERYG